MPAEATTTFTVSGVSPGDLVDGSFSQPLSGLGLTFEVSAANTVKAILLNNTGSSVDLGSGVVKALVTKVY